MSDAAPRFRVPHVFVIIAALLVLTALAGLFLPGGSFERDDKGRVVPGSFQYDRALPQDERPESPGGAELVLAVLMAPLEGIVDAANIVAFLFVIGGAFKVIERSGAFVALIHAVVRLFKDRGILVVPSAMLIFSIGGAVFGMSEETIPFVLLFVPLAKALGYPPIIGVAIPLIGAHIGFAGAMLNPFTVGVAQGIAELPFPAGWEFRTLCWFVLTTFAVAWVVRRAMKLYDPEAAEAGRLESSDASELDGRKIGILATLGLGIGVMIWGIAEFEWYVLEIGAVFLAIGLVSGLLARLGGEGMSLAFTEGARDLLGAALVIGMARGVVLLATDLRVLDPMLFGMSSVLEHLPAKLALIAMFLFQSLLNFFVPSGSGQAALTMPIMAPLADLLALSRQQAVLAFQFGDGFSNMIIPTSAVVMGSLEAGRVRYEQWFRFAIGLQLWLLLIGSGLLALSVLVGFGR